MSANKLKAFDVSWVGKSSDGQGHMVDGYAKRAGTYYKLVPIDKIVPNPHQPRKTFDGIETLAESIRRYGLKQPIGVVEIGSGEGYVLEWGERRWLACKSLQMEYVPAMVLEKASPLTALIENRHRRRVPPVEEALYVQRLLDNGYSVEDLALALDCTLAAVRQLVKISQMPSDLQAEVAELGLSKRMARDVAYAEPGGARKILKQEKARQASVRRTRAVWERFVAACGKADRLAGLIGDNRERAGEGKDRARTILALDQAIESLQRLKRALGNN